MIGDGGAPRDEPFLSVALKWNGSGFPLGKLIMVMALPLGKCTSIYNGGVGGWSADARPAAVGLVQVQSGEPGHLCLRCGEAEAWGGLGWGQIN